jgi:hypothetical protein
LCKSRGVDRIRNHGYIQQELREKGEYTRSYGSERMRPSRIDKGNVGSVFSSVSRSRWFKMLDIIGFVVIFHVEFAGRLLVLVVEDRPLLEGEVFWSEAIRS